MKGVLLTVYAFTGYDTLSVIYKKNKITPCRKVQANNVLRIKLLVFNDSKVYLSAVADAEKHLLLVIFGAKNTENLDFISLTVLPNVYRKAAFT